MLAPLLDRQSATDRDDAEASDHRDDGRRPSSLSRRAAADQRRATEGSRADAVRASLRRLVGRRARPKARRRWRSRPTRCASRRTSAAASRKQVEFREAISALHDVVIERPAVRPEGSHRVSRSGASSRATSISRRSPRSQRKLSDDIKTLQEELSRLEQQRIAPPLRLLQGAAEVLRLPLQARQGAVVQARSGHHGPPGPGVLRVLLARRVDLRPARRELRGVRRARRARVRHDEHRLLRQAVRRVPEDPQLQDDVARRRSGRLQRQDLDGGAATARSRSTCPTRGCAAFCRSAPRRRCRRNVVELHPMDVHNLCLVLRRNKELFGPRSLRFQLTPGAPVKIVVEPWNHVVDCPRSRQTDGDRRRDPRVGPPPPAHPRAPVAARQARPRVPARLRPADVLGRRPRRPVVHARPLRLDAEQLVRGRQLRSDGRARGRRSTSRSSASSPSSARPGSRRPRSSRAQTGLATPIVASALAGWVQAGRAIYDLDRGVYRKRELTRDPLPMDKLRFANPREEAAAQILHRGKIAIDRADTAEGGARGSRGSTTKDREQALRAEDHVRRRPPPRRTASAAATTSFATACTADRASTCSRCAPRTAAASTTRSRCEDQRAAARARRRADAQSRENFQARVPPGGSCARPSCASRPHVRTRSPSSSGLADRAARQRRARPPAGGDRRGAVRCRRHEPRPPGCRARARAVPDEHARTSHQARLARRARRGRDRDSGRARARARRQQDRALGRAVRALRLDRRPHGDVPVRRRRPAPPPEHPKLVAHRNPARANLPPSTQLPGAAARGCREAVVVAPRRRCDHRQTTDDAAAVDRSCVSIAIIGELAKGSAIQDRATVLQLLRVAHGAADRDDARVFALAAALKDCPAISESAERSGVARALAASAVVTDIRSRVAGGPRPCNRAADRRPCVNPAHTSLAHSILCVRQCTSGDSEGVS